MWNNFNWGWPSRHFTLITCSLYKSQLSACHFSALSPCESKPGGYAAMLEREKWQNTPELPFCPGQWLLMWGIQSDAKWPEFQQNLLLTALGSPGLYQMFHTWTWNTETSLFNLSFLDLLLMGLRCQVTVLGSSRERLHLHSLEFPKELLFWLEQTPVLTVHEPQICGWEWSHANSSFQYDLETNLKPID